jgi:hypothetical protein
VTHQSVYRQRLYQRFGKQVKNKIFKRNQSTTLAFNFSHIETVYCYKHINDPGADLLPGEAKRQSGNH